MSTKFEQLLDYLVNEEMDKANELFHEIVVEKSRDIYENLIAEESAEDEEMDESAEEDEEMDESHEELEDAYDIDDESDDDMSSPDNGFDSEDDDATGMLGQEVGMGGDDDESSEDDAMLDIKTAIADLEAAFAELETAQGGDMGSDDFDDDDMDSDSEFGDADSEFGSDDGDEEDDEDESMGFSEGRRMTREYVEKVGNDWEKNSQKTQGQSAGADTGDKMGSPAEGKSPVSSGKGKPTTGASASNILGDHKTGAGTNIGTSPNGKTGGFVKNAQDMKTGNGNVPGGKMGIKNLSKVAGGHGAEKKGGTSGPVGSGTGEKAGQTSVAPIKPFLKKL